MKQNEDLWRTAKPLTHQCILRGQTLQSKGKSSKSKEGIPNWQELQLEHLALSAMNK